ncbi:S24 family peptidase [Gluconacetobacter sacchari DSM 12717]|uniref:S24 family peptidase n=1 Tax=Gluconacetobacter sacchari DSM 12717 TaxID=1307940 RepID=A0ABQ0P762_9PROT|nr:S24 family peptidase [Gluconacetobacter sacchari DSM 12717]
MVKAAGGNEPVAQKALIGTTTLSGYMNGKEWKFSHAEKLAEACGVSLQWLLFGDSSPVATPESVPTPSNDNIDHLDYYDVAASAGFGAYASGAPAPEKLAISRHFLRHDLGLTPQSAIMIQVDGDSMEPTLSAGNRIIIDKRPKPALNGIHVLVVNGSLLVKRLAATSDGIRIISDNDRYPSETAAASRFHWGAPDGDDTITIIGRVAYRLQALS